jgi:hypothetical protein
MLLIAGVGVFLVSLSAMTVVFWRLKLSDGRYALGLPDGSVRAVIALTLILMFAIMSIFLYLNVANTKNTEANDLAKQLVTTLSTLVVALSSFYFGANTAANNAPPPPPDAGAGAGAGAGAAAANAVDEIA